MHFEKIINYVGEENFEIIRSLVDLTSYYQCEDEITPLTFDITANSKTYIYLDVYDLGGDEGAGFRIDKEEWPIVHKSSKSEKYLYYFIDNTFVKSNEKTKDIR